MADMNKTFQIGRLVRDAELKYTNSGMAVTKFSIAVSKKRKDGDEWKNEPHYFDVILWGKLGENLNPYLTKGKQICIEGELTQERWQQDGQNRSKVVITATHIQLLGGNQKEDKATSEDFPPPAPSGTANDFGDDIPF